MKSLLSILTLLAVLTVSGCGGSSSDQNTKSNPNGDRQLLHKDKG